MLGRRLGFTLIELLVVIAIIAILAAILFPILRDAKVAGQRGSCASNLKQLGLAIKMYADDNSGCFPATSDYGGDVPPAGYASWTQWVRKYLPKGSGVFACPGMGFVNMVWINRPQTDPKEFINLGYGYNEYINYSWHWNVEKLFMRESTLRAPQQVMLLADCFFNALVNDWNDSYMPDVDGFPSGFNRMRYADVVLDSITGNVKKKSVRHGGPNVMFCDLHVTRMLPNEFKYGSGGNRQWPLIYPAAQKF